MAAAVKDFSHNRVTTAEAHTILLDDGPPILTDHDNKRRTVVKRGFVIAVGGAAIVVAGLAGCSDKKESSATETAASGEGKAKVTIDDKDQNVQGAIVCADVPGSDTYSITVGEAMEAVSAIVTKGDPPEVNQVALVLDGQPLAYNKGTGGDASAKKDGKTYTITGNIIGMPDMANPTAGPKTHKFSMEVTCP